MKRSFSTIQRVDRKRTLNITADIDKANYDQGSITAAIQKKVPEIIAELNPRIGIDMEGEARESREMGTSLRNGFMLAFFLIYALLAIPFKSYGQPFIVLGIIPFGLVGAILGHMIMGISASFPSIFGILALMGVVVNDSLVLVDYINRHRSGRGLMEAIQVAGVARFRPIVLTSLTTFFGLIPLLLEQSTQSQFLKPMAVSLGFGILFATVITLLVTPLFYCIYEMALGGLRRLWPSPKAETLEGTLS
jgi:multidrug efflux pump subunit AcrB